MKRKLLKLTLALSLFLTLLAPALAEEVKVLLDVPAPYAEDVKWFPGGRYLVLILANYQKNEWSVVIVDLGTRAWRPMQWVKDRKELGKGPLACVQAGCGYMLSAQGKGLVIADPYEDPDCAMFAHQDARAERVGIGRFFPSSVLPGNLAVSASGRYATLRHIGPPPGPPEYYGDAFPVYRGLWIARMDLKKETWRDVQGENRRDPLIWELSPGLDVLTANWYYDPAEKLDRIAIITLTDPGEEEMRYDAKTARLLVLEVQP